MSSNFAVGKLGPGSAFAGMRLYDPDADGHQATAHQPCASCSGGERVSGNLEPSLEGTFENLGQVSSIFT